jgi:putative ABC transport system permease protein
LLLAVSFGVLWLLMGGVGFSGVRASFVCERAPEMAIRLALGASPSRVLQQVLQYGLVLAGSGAALGVAVSAAIAPSMQSLLFGVRPVDPFTFVVVPSLVIAVAVAACAGPAWRSMRVDPVRALRME